MDVIKIESAVGYKLAADIYLCLTWDECVDIRETLHEVIHLDDHTGIEKLLFTAPPSAFGIRA